MKPVTQQESSHTFDFEQHAEAVLRSLRTAFAAIIEELPHSVERPQELSRALRIDRNLGWKINKLVQSPNPFLAAQHVPGSAAIQIFLDAAKRRNVSRASVDAARAALKDYEQLVREHAGDRASLDMMMTSCAPKGRERMDLTHRRAAFRSNSYIWGIQAKTQLKTDLLHPAGEAGMLDIAALRGFIGLRRIRANVTWTVARARCANDDGSLRRELNREPLDPGVRALGGEQPVPLLREFCSKPLPRFRRVGGPHGFLQDKIVEGPVGNKGALNCVTGEVVRAAVPYYRDQHNLHADLIARVRTPCEQLVFDQLVHEDLFGRESPELVVYSELSDDTPAPAFREERLVLPVCDTVEYLGKGPDVLHTPAVPRYAEMARFVFDQLGWDGDRFNVFRVRMAFPPIPTSVVMQRVLPPRPDS